jgi:hypothetical protein
MDEILRVADFGLGTLALARDLRLFPLLCALLFPLLAIVPAPGPFLSRWQGLAL